jgi:2-methylcitrate dehydratase PrpD
VSGHALDYDDVNLAMRVHPTTVILPGVLALAQAHRLTGRSVIEAFVAGYEAAGMIGALISASHYASGFHATGTIGAFGAAAACAHLLNLDEATPRAPTASRAPRPPASRRSSGRWPSRSTPGAHRRLA